MPLDWCPQQGTAGHGLVDELARTQRQLTLTRLERDEARDIMARMKDSLDAYFRQPDDARLGRIYEWIETYLENER